MHRLRSTARATIAPTKSVGAMTQSARPFWAAGRVTCRVGGRVGGRGLRQKVAGRRGKNLCPSTGAEATFLSVPPWRPTNAPRLHDSYRFENLLGCAEIGGQNFEPADINRALMGKSGPNEPSVSRSNDLGTPSSPPFTVDSTDGDWIAEGEEALAKGTSIGR